MRIPLKLFVLTLTIFIAAFTAKAQDVAVNTNLVHDAILTPNLGVEVKVDSSWTLDFNGALRPWPTSDKVRRKYRHLTLQLKGRKWIDGTPFRGRFYDIDLLYAHYNIGNLNMHYFGMFQAANHHRIQGNLYGAGSRYGYAWQLGSGFGVNVWGGADLSWTHYRKYNCDYCGSLIKHESRVYLLPEIGVEVNYQFGKANKTK